MWIVDHLQAQNSKNQPGYSMNRQNTPKDTQPSIILFPITAQNIMTFALQRGSNQLTHAQQILPSIPDGFEKRFEWPNKASHEMFCARKTQVDQERLAMENQIIRFFIKHGYNSTQAYQFHQQISFFIQTRNSGAIVPLDEEFYYSLNTLLQTNQIDLKSAIIWLIGGKIYNEITKTSIQIPRTPADDLYRTWTSEQTLNFGNISLSVKQLTRLQAYELLQKANIWLRSSNMRQRETGKKFGPNDTCLEWLTLSTIDWLKTLKEEFQKHLNKDEECKIIINGWTEFGHRLWSNIIMGHIKSWFKTHRSHYKAHGTGFTIDIRLTGKEGLLLKKIFPDKQWFTKLTNKNDETFYFEYLYHGTESDRHLHLTILDEEMYQTIYNKR